MSEQKENLTPLEKTAQQYFRKTDAILQRPETRERVVGLFGIMKTMGEDFARATRRTAIRHFTQLALPFALGGVALCAGTKGESKAIPAAITAAGVLRACHRQRKDKERAACQASAISGRVILDIGFSIQKDVPAVLLACAETGVGMVIQGDPESLHGACGQQILRQYNKERNAATGTPKF